MSAKQPIRTAQSRAADPRAAAREFHAAVAQPGMALVVFFCSSNYDLDILAEEMRGLFGDTRVVGCTTAGEIGPDGYCEHSLAGASFAQGACSAVARRLDHLQEFDIARGETFTQALLQQLAEEVPSANPQNSFAFLLVDGLSMREEIVARTFQNALGKLPLFGGSAGDGLEFRRTHVYDDGAFHSDSAVLVLISTPLPFKLFKTQHFVATDERLVVTEADAARRIVREINGMPAAEEYARLLGIDVAELNPVRFATSPVVVLIDGANYVRSIQKLNEDGSLTFYCAIEEGLVLRVAKGVDLVENLEQTFARLRAEIGAPQVVFSCDCILRALEVKQVGLTQRVAEIFRANNTVGFATYGEQFGGVHINQTLTGIALGSLPESKNV
jgi:hypothetical protein